MINQNNKTYQAAAAANVVVSNGKAILERILIGADVASSVIEISDHASDGDGNVKIKYTGSALMTASGGVIEVGALFKNGITADLTNQTDVVFIWTPTV